MHEGAPAKKDKNTAKCPSGAEDRVKGGGEAPFAWDNPPLRALFIALELDKIT